MPRLRRPIDPKLMLASFGLAVGLALIVFGFGSARTGHDATGLPPEVELIFPQPGDRVLRQTSVLADLIPGYTGKLIIDDQDIGVVEVQAAEKVQPGQEVNGGIVVTKFDLGSNTLTYEPQQGAPIAQFAPGPHRVKLVYWRIDLGPDSARSHTWEFNVTG